ncbi:MAG: hypothetical protein KA099_11200 [Alphaproteobacteria bacterium]|nr:hypothetical protein [Alphaproteobacteria bacterium]MBP7757871.1 hypothetical protein [Alphaproteobacteria bacterium]MBP7761198.1 hypothetical protein [Alphaproteobacteria bacterium]MBP7905881.1 hypothetical protein [Alphaproteobacteria bacterium]
MQKMPSYVHIIFWLLVVSLMAVALLYIWFPDVVSEQAFVKVGVSFAVVLIGSVAMSLIGKSMKGGCCPHGGESKTPDPPA